MIGEKNKSCYKCQKPFQIEGIETNYKILLFISTLMFSPKLMISVSFQKSATSNEAEMKDHRKSFNFVKELLQSCT